MTRIPVSLKRALVECCGTDAVLDEPEDLAFYGADRCRGGWPVAPSLIVRPSSTKQVAEVVRACARHTTPIVPSGGRTGLTGAATATRGEVVVSLDRMHRIVEVKPSARLIVCEAGATVQAVQDAAEAHGLMYPIDFAAKGSAHIGGSIATNAGGVRVIRYGNTRAWVSGLEAVLASGEVVQLGGELVKDNTGYDLKELLIGSEGTLGIVTVATMRLCARPVETVVALCSLADGGGVTALFERVRGSALQLSAFECFDDGAVRAVMAHRSRPAGPFQSPSPHNVLVEVEGNAQAQTDALADLLSDAQEAGEISDALVASGEQQKQTLWDWREDISESLHAHTPHKADVSVPVDRVMEFASRWKALVADEFPDCQAVVFGHVGDGNLHLNLLRPATLEFDAFLARVHAFDPKAFALVAQYGGSISAEHGIGLLKREYLHFSRSAAELEMMRAIKSALDPTGLFNPGKIF